MSAGEARRVGVIHEEVHRMVNWEDRHKRLLARITIVIALTLVVRPSRCALVGSEGCVPVAVG
jgi:hypothetical protein